MPGMKEGKERRRETNGFGSRMTDMLVFSDLLYLLIPYQ